MCIFIGEKLSKDEIVIHNVIKIHFLEKNWEDIIIMVLT